MTKITDETLLKAFGKNLRKLREDRGPSQEALANDADIPINQVGRNRKGRDKYYNKYCKCYCQSIEDRAIGVV